jgi:hypothetical protein
MVCYARRATWIAIFGIIVLVMLGADQTHLFNVMGLLLTLAIVVGGATAGAGLTVLALRSVQRKRAATGACVTCRFQCQHAMVPPQQRMWLISSVDRGTAQPRPQVFVPMPRIPARAHAGLVRDHARLARDHAGLARDHAGPVREHSGPQWPERPLITTARSE